MNTAFGEFLTSSQFTFLVGPDKTAISVHKAPLARLSRPFDAMMNEPMSEDKIRTATLEDTDPDTFVRFVEFASTGTFTTMHPSKLTISEAAETPEPPADHSHNSPLNNLKNPPIGKLNASDTYVRAGQAKRRRLTFFDMTAILRKSKMPISVKPTKKSFKGTETVVERIEYPWETLNLPDLHPLVTLTLEKYDRNSDRAYAEAPLALARLYVFATRYGVDLLKVEVMDAMHTTLNECYAFSEEVNKFHLKTVTDLVRFLYDPDKTQAVDPLRKLVVDYVHTNIGVLAPEPGFQTVLQEVHRLTYDLLFKATPQPHAKEVKSLIAGPLVTPPAGFGFQK